MAPHHTHKDLPNNGWTFDINDFGYYSGFTDQFDEGPIKVRICHECVNKFLETFPLLSMFVPRGSHPMWGPSEKPCCKYAWKQENIGDASFIYMPTEDGEEWEVQ